MGGMARLGAALIALVNAIVPPAPASTRRSTGSLRHLMLRAVRRDFYTNGWGSPHKGQDRRIVTVATHVGRSKIYGALRGQIRFDTLNGYTPPAPDMRPTARFEVERPKAPRPAVSYRAARRNARTRAERVFA